MPFYGNLLISESRSDPPEGFTQLSLAEVDLEDVLHRLTWHARHLIDAAACLGADEIVMRGGEGPADLASQTLLKLLDPEDKTVVWSEKRGQPTTAGLVAYLRVVLERDFLDLVRSKRYRTTVYPDQKHDAEDDRPPGVRMDQIPAKSASPEEVAAQRQQTSWVLAQFVAYPELEAILKLQLEPNGYNAYSNQELARMLGLTVTEIENRKKRVKTRLKVLAAERRASEGVYD
jgi:DNA-directed RNA polymerase specialized sigma24 family protein